MDNYRRIGFLAGGLLLVMLLLAACGAQGPASTPTAEPSPQPTMEATPTEAANAGNQAAQRAVEALAQQLQLAPSAITVASVTAVQWPDSCLGIHLPGQACAMHVVDGYKVILEAQGYRYEYRTNGDGSQAMPALALTWHREGGIAGFCDDLIVYQSGAAVAMSCTSGVPQGAGQAALDKEQVDQLQKWLAALSPFQVDRTDQATADAMTIRLSFEGWGSAAASDADKQAIETFAADLYAQITQGAPAGAGDPGQVVNEFLASLQQDPSGESSLVYLSQALKADIQSGDSVRQLLGLEGNYRSFGISATHMSDGGKYALVEVGLNVVSPLKRAFEMVDENGNWVIDTFVSYSMPALNVPAEAYSADQVVLDFVHDLQAGDVAAAWALLSPVQSTLSQDDVSALAQAAQQISAVSLDLTQASPDQMTYTATLWVTPASGQPNNWMAGANTRIFHLVQTAGGWLIAGIDTPNTGS